MNIQEYISSGILQGYCLDLLSPEARAEVQRICRIHPEVARELKEIEEGLEQFAIAHARWPGNELREKIWDTLDNLNKEQAMQADDLPLINRFTDYNKWRALVKPFMPRELQDEQYMHVLRNSDGILQMLVVAKTDVPDEVHEDLKESLLILEGECECIIGNKVIHLGPGGFLDIPLHVHHNVRKLSPQVAAIVQHIAL